MFGGSLSSDIQPRQSVAYCCCLYLHFPLPSDISHIQLARSDDELSRFVGMMLIHSPFLYPFSMPKNSIAANEEIP